MVENLQGSAQNGKPRTRSTKKLTVEEAIEILQQAVINCQHSGQGVQVAPITHKGKCKVALILENCDLQEGKIVRLVGEGDATK